MEEFLVAVVQSVCMCGYFYGAYLVIAHGASGGSPRAGESRQPARRFEDEDTVVLRRYLAYDL